MERTLILVKPDAFGRGLTGEIISRFERKGLRIGAMREMTVERELAERHYAEHAQRAFFGELVDFITSGPLVAMVLEGESAVAAARQVIGATDPLQAAPGSIRDWTGTTNSFRLPLFRNTGPFNHCTRSLPPSAAAWQKRPSTPSSCGHGTRMA